MDSEQNKTESGASAEGEAQPRPDFTPPPEGLWATVVASVKRGHYDLTRIPIRQAILLLAVPMFLEMVMESIFAVVDIFFVSRLGAAAVMAVGITESLMTIVFTVAIGLSIGVTAMVARRIGEGDSEGASRTAGQAIVLGAIIAAIIAVVGVTQADRLLALMGAEQEAIDIGVGYTRVMMGGNIVILLLFLLNAAFRGAGDAAIAMRVLWLGNAINIVLDPCLIFGLGPFPELGVTGAAVATNIGRGTAVLFQLWVLFGGHERLRVSRRHLRWDGSLLARLFKLSGTGMFQTFVGTASWVALIRILAEFGAEAVAGYTIGIRVILLAILPAWGLSNAAATLVGQGLGSGQPDRAEESAWLAARFNLFFLGALGVVFVAFAPGIVSLFGGDELTRSYAVDTLRVVSLGFFFYAYGMVLTAAFNGAGDAWTPTWINIGCFWMFEIPLAWVLAHELGLGPRGVWIAITIAFSSVAVVSWFLFRRGTWKLKQV